MSILQRSKLHLVLGMLFLFAFLLVVFSVINGYFDGFDGAVDRLVTYQEDFLAFSFFNGLTNLASTSVIIILSAVVLLFLIYRKRYKDILLFVFTLGGGAVIEILLKSLVHRTRPIGALVDASRYSFPSGHALKAVLFFSLLIYLFLRNFKRDLSRYAFVFTCAVLILLIGFSRVYLHVHWVSDVIGGFLFGLSWLFFSLVVCDWFCNLLVPQCS